MRMGRHSMPAPTARQAARKTAPSRMPPPPPRSAAMVFKQLHGLDVQEEEFIPFGGMGEARFLGGEWTTSRACMATAGPCLPDAAAAAAVQVSPRSTMCRAMMDRCVTRQPRMRACRASRLRGQGIPPAPRPAGSTPTRPHPPTRRHAHTRRQPSPSLWTYISTPSPNLR